MSEPIDLTVVVPVRDEAPNVEPLAHEIVAALDGVVPRWEVVFVDDGSVDDGPDRVLAVGARDARVRLVRLDRNHGQSTALVAGVEAARGTWIATLDGDRQNDPADLRTLWPVVSTGRADVVTGVRVKRADSAVRRISSRIANGIRNRVSGDHVTDVGCSIRIFPRAAMLRAFRFEGMHRFLPTLLRTEGCSVIEVPVGHRPRPAGRSKYGIRNRLWRGLVDLFAVRWYRSRRIEYGTIGDPAAGDDTIDGGGAG